MTRAEIERVLEDIIRSPDASSRTVASATRQLLELRRGSFDLPEDPEDPDGDELAAHRRRRAG